MGIFSRNFLEWRKPWRIRKAEIVMLRTSGLLEKLTKAKKQGKEQREKRKRN